jgi:hypothetical protein
VKCVHRWVCEAPGGPLIWARCRKCGAERAFQADGGMNDNPLEKHRRSVLGPREVA